MSDIPFALQKTEDEIAAMSPTERAAYDDLQRRIVFGHDSKTDRDGNPIEQGLGSPTNPSRNSIEAYKRWHGLRSQDPDPAFSENLARMESEYAAHVAARKAKAPVKRSGAVA